MGAAKEIVRGLFHWTAVHPEIGVRVSSYYLAKERVLIDPLLPTGGLAWLEEHGPPEHILLTCRLHSRHSAKIVKRFGATVWCHKRGLGHLAPELDAQGFVPGDELPGGARVVKIGAISPDESALLLPRHRAASVADGVIRDGKGPLAFVPDELLVDDPADAQRVKKGLKAAFRRLAREEWRHLLLAHGLPIVDTGREQLLAWASA